MRLARKDMRKVLEVLKESYPDDMNFGQIQDKSGVESDDLDVALIYLSEHELVEVDLCGTIGRTGPAVCDAKITARGIDFMLDDGGLSAILGVVTVKLHEDTVRALLLNGIEASSAPEAEKSALREAIGKAPATSFNAVINSLVGLALSKAPEAVQLLSRHFLAAM